MESLRFDVEPFGIRTTIVEPGFFRTELLVEGSSTIWPELSIDDYADRTTSTIEAWRGMNGQQGGDPAKLAAALVTIAALDEPAAAVRRRRRRRRRRRAEGTRPPRPDRRPPRAVHQPRPRRHAGMSAHIRNGDRTRPTTSPARSPSSPAPAPASGSPPPPALRRGRSRRRARRPPRTCRENRHPGPASRRSPSARRDRRRASAARQGWQQVSSGVPQGRAVPRR